jgi:hypothetical protein
LPFPTPLRITLAQVLCTVFERTRQKTPSRKVTAQNTDSAIPGVELRWKSPVIVQRKLDGDLQRTRNIRGRLRLPVSPRDVVRRPFRQVVIVGQCLRQMGIELSRVFRRVAFVEKNRIEVHSFCGGHMSPESVPTAGGPDVLPNPIPEPDPEPPKPDPTPAPSPVPPVPEPAPAF